MIFTGSHNKIARPLERAMTVAGDVLSSCQPDVLFRNFMMPFSFRSLWLGACLASVATLVAPFSSVAQTNYYAPSGGEYPVVDTLPGDQVFPEVSLSTSGGFVVWQDNATDGSGLGISAQRLDGSFSKIYGAFRVNAAGAGDQQNPQVALLKNGGAVFVWQGGAAGAQHIYARFLSPSGTFLTTNDILVNS